MKRRVVVTGLGMVTPLGTGVQKNWEAVCSGTSGIKTITFDAATTKQYLQRAYESGWAGVIKLSPQHGPAMQKLFTKK